MKSLRWPPASALALRHRTALVGGLREEVASFLLRVALWGHGFEKQTHALLPVLVFPEVPAGWHCLLLIQRAPKISARRTLPMLLNRDG